MQLSLHCKKALSGHQLVQKPVSSSGIFFCTEYTAKSVEPKVVCPVRSSLQEASTPTAHRRLCICKICSFSDEVLSLDEPALSNAGFSTWKRVRHRQDLNLVPWLKMVLSAYCNPVGVWRLHPADEVCLG